MPDITRLLVANRGEIARRVIRTADELGIETVAVFSEPDRALPFVDEATYAVALGGMTSAESYLDAAKVLDAAKRTGADAIHPGYGFLSENAEFAQAVADAGLVWVGPTPASMRAMALKVEAKRIAADAGVPLVPGAELAADVSDDDLLATGEQVGYPLLVKASAGGGGKGMRVVRGAGDLVEAVQGARREAASSFGDATVFLERYLERSRHVEVQVFGDTHGNVVHLFERECSIQRRHQKVVEESPSPGATPATLERMYAAAVSLASAIGYVGAGTVEFLVAGEGDAQEFFFLEMNTRLQVEHPVTEMVTGLDLVEWQFLVAQGEPLPLAQEDIAREGHAIEVRLYAEDPANGYLPSTGTITSWDDTERLDVRVDAGVGQGSVVSPYYDPMLAKAISHGATRDQAADALSLWLRRQPVVGVSTNRLSLAAVLDNPRFRQGDTTTSFLDENPDVLAPRLPDEILTGHLEVAGLVLAEIADGEFGGAPLGWRNVVAAPEVWELVHERGTSVVAWAWDRRGVRLWAIPDWDATSDRSPWSAQELAALSEPRRSLGIEYAGEVGDDGFARYRVERDDVRSTVFARVEWGRDAAPVAIAVDAHGWLIEFEVVEPWAASAHEGAGAGPTTPVPGTVTHVAVAVGDEVEAGAALVVLEAMKMEHTIRADAAGTVTEIHVSVGQSVDAHTVVATVEASS
jgi:3-methylcrotonyl-CoA carboxylase alpha subunit